MVIKKIDILHNVKLCGSPDVLIRIWATAAYLVLCDVSRALVTGNSILK
jgi:hypothetical protein